MNRLRRLLAMVAGGGVICSASVALADWTPLITADDFDGIQTDVMTVAGGIISVTLIIIGVAYLVRAMVK